jgi:hypothetical protein
MKPLFAFALLFSTVFTMSGFVNHPAAAKRVVKAHRTVPSWPINGTHAGYTFAIYGSGNVPSYVIFTSPVSSGPFTFSLQGNGAYLATITGTVSSTINAIELGIYTNQEGYVLTFHPDRE